MERPQTTQTRLRVWGAYSPPENTNTREQTLDHRLSPASSRNDASWSVVTNKELSNNTGMHPKPLNLNPKV